MILRALGSRRTEAPFFICRPRVQRSLQSCLLGFIGSLCSNICFGLFSLRYRLQSALLRSHDVGNPCLVTGIGCRLRRLVGSRNEIMNVRNVELRLQ